MAGLVANGKFRKSHVFQKTNVKNHAFLKWKMSKITHFSLSVTIAIVKKFTFGHPCHAARQQRRTGSAHTSFGPIYLGFMNLKIECLGLVQQRHIQKI
jgi:hypothetical protein